MLPWRVERELDRICNVFNYYKNNLRATHDAEISFYCGFHGRTGGPAAISQIARILSKRYRVEFVSHPTSEYNSILAKSINIVSKPSASSQLMIFDVTAGKEIISNAKKSGKQTLVTCHGFPNTLHGLLESEVRSALDSANHIHFVSQSQQDEFKIPEGKYFIIKNTHQQMIKTRFGNNAGIIGGIDNQAKNLPRSLEIASASDASKVHVWGSDADNRWPTAVFHPWTNNKHNIYNSIDVLISMSRNETFGMIVSEALSAGVPCLLSDIPAFRSFSECESVRVVAPDDTETAVQCLNALLENKKTLRNIAIKYWQDNLSESVVEQLWFSKIKELLCDDATNR
ncbi:MAG: glycosyltransferase [Desulfobulbaceae bacterium]|nr:glycosyltransferase [Desulfobulbaceae bacterium]